MRDAPGFAHLARCLKIRWPSVKGFRFEARCAAVLKGEGKQIEFLGKQIPAASFLGFALHKTDFDIVADGVAYSCKCGRNAAGTKSVQNWVLQALRAAAGDPSKVKLLLTPDVVISGPLATWLKNTLDLEISDVVRRL